MCGKRYRTRTIYLKTYILTQNYHDNFYKDFPIEIY